MTGGIPFDLGDLFGNLGGIGGMGGMGSMGNMGGIGNPRERKRRRGNEPAAFDALTPGTKVTIVGLTNRQDLNGVVSSVQFFDRGSNRYMVSRQDTGQMISLKS